jgi:hypothetical protein
MTRSFIGAGGLLPVHHCPRRASLVKALCDRRTTGYRGKVLGERTREDGLDKPGPKVAEFAPIGSGEGYGADGRRHASSPVLDSHLRVPVAAAALRARSLLPEQFDILVGLGAAAKCRVKLRAS